jgi:two-component system sensor histidine kinase KdpD
MLEAARADKANGVDVVVGYVEPHGRRETEALLEGLEGIPPLQVSHHGAVLHEFDLDATLARQPELALVDELAHTNALGLRHVKRWQDVDELLAAGIDVYSTVNVQHVESLNDVVAQITGTVVRETIPDTVIERADDIELVDITPEELLGRLSEGKVYVPAQAEWALANFFQRPNLVALRASSRSARPPNAFMPTCRRRASGARRSVPGRRPSCCWCASGPARRRPASFEPPSALPTFCMPPGWQST